MLTIIYDNDKFIWNSNIKTINQNEMEVLHNIPKGYTSVLDQKKAGDLIGDGWTVDVVKHIFKGLKK